LIRRLLASMVWSHDLVDETDRAVFRAWRCSQAALISRPLTGAGAAATRSQAATVV
jgi:hypothetical protein